MQTPNFWKDHNRARDMSQKVAEFKKDIDTIEHFQQEIGMMREMMETSEDAELLESDIQKNVGKLLREFRQFELSKFLAEPYDNGNAVISIYAGAGGKDSEDWVAILRRMYERFAEKRGWKVEIIHEHWGEFKGPGGYGLKNVTLAVKGGKKKDFVYGFLKKEAGVHRLVRISPFSAKQLRHTSFAMVLVMPEFIPPEEIAIKPEELSIDFFRSSGPGGQNVNKRETAVRITHIPTGTQVASQGERSQERNREIAMNLLRARLYQKKISEQEALKKEVRGETVSAEWGHQIRSYVFHPYQLVKDHRTNVETGNVDAVLDGELDQFIEAELNI